MIPSVYPEHPVTYRQEIIEPLFHMVGAGESCMVVGAASMAKSNLVRFILRRDVQQFYLKEKADNLLVVLADVNRMSEYNDLAGFELLLNSLVETVSPLGEQERLYKALSELHRDVVLHKDRLLAQRYFERAVRLLCVEQDIRLVILVDETDPLYCNASPNFFNNLRALRDEFKYKLSYILLTRATLPLLRPVDECEAFVELFSRNVLGLKPYRQEDALRVISQLETRHAVELEESERNLLYRLSGGHPGLMVASFDVYCGLKKTGEAVDEDALIGAAQLQEECEKLWKGLDADEQWLLQRLASDRHLSNESQAVRLLMLKGIIRMAKENGEWEVYSPVFQHFLLERGVEETYAIQVDEEAGIVWVAGRRIEGLAPLEYRLILFLYENRGKVKSRDDILQALYPQEFRPEGDMDVQDNRVDALIRRLRTKVEPNPEKPRYIITRRGQGYMIDIGKSES
jgi:hypothetical protein